MLAINPGQAVTLAELTPYSLQEQQQILWHLFHPPFLTLFQQDFPDLHLFRLV